MSPAAQAGRDADALGGLLGPLASGPAAFLADRDGALRASNEGYSRLAATLDPALATAVGARIPVPVEVLGQIEVGGAHLEYDLVIESNGRSRNLKFELWSPAAGSEMTIIGLVRDSTLVASLARRVQANEARFDDIARLTSDWVWEIDIASTFTYVSARIAELIGVPTRFIIGQSLSSCGRFEGFPEANFAGHPNTSAMAPFTDVHYEMFTADGERRLFRLNGVPIFDAESGRFVGFRGSARDVTAHAAAEARVFAAQSRLVHAIESIPQGFALFDIDDRLLLCNSSYENLLTGSSNEPLALGTIYSEVLGRAASSGRFAGSGEAVERLAEACLTHHRKTVDGFEINLSDGRWILMSVDRTDDGGTVEVWNDITELRRREAAIRAAEEEARAALDLAEAGNRAKGEFLATMSHELRTPLNAIIGFSEIIKNEMYGPVGNESYKDYASDIHSSGKHLLSLISDILEFAKIEAGNLKLDERSINLAALLESCIRIVMPRAEQGELSLEMRLPDDLPRLKADETRLKQIVINLLGNAVKFTPPGGRVSLNAQVDGATGCRISVSDTGIGIAKEDIPRALTAFGQIESQLSRRYEGTGLGLTLAKSLTEMHGGRLTIDSERNVGTTVTIHVPASRIVPRDT